MKLLHIDRHISNPQCKEGALFILHEYLNANLIDPNNLLTEPEMKIYYEKWKRSRNVMNMSYQSSMSPMRLRDSQH